MPDRRRGARDAVPPGGTIGILGSGQLGRMLAMAAARIGLKTHIYCDEPGPAFDVAATHTQAPYDDRAALDRFAASVDVVTYEFENVPVDAAEHLAARVPARPGPKAFAVAQDRLTEKTFITDLGIAVAPFAPVEDQASLETAIRRIGTPSILKTRRLGYDGKGQARLAKPDDAASALDAIGRAPAVLEGHVVFAREVSVLVVRGLDGGKAYYDIPENTHSGGILRRSVVPAAISAAHAERAREIAASIADALDYVGVLAVEMFHTPDDGKDPLVVNEIAPRVHNSGHWTIEACAISQFENHIRAIAGWPLGTTERHSDAEMLNLIGPEALDWQRLAGDPSAAVHLYGKREAREGRKMGHLTRLSPKSAD